MNNVGEVSGNDLSSDGSSDHVDVRERSNDVSIDRCGDGDLSSGGDVVDDVSRSLNRVTSKDDVLVSNNVDDPSSRRRAVRRDGISNNRVEFSGRERNVVDSRV